jgi:hypothetical protein
MDSTTIATAVAPVRMIFSVNDGLIGRVMADLPEADEWRRPSPSGNPLLWIIGHAAETRASVLLGLLGDRYQTGWGELFARGAQVGERSRYPAAAEVRRVWNDVAARLQRTLVEIPESRLAGPTAGLPIPGARTFGDQIAFFAMHDSYHVGQVGYVWRALGHNGLAG